MASFGGKVNEPFGRANTSNFAKLKKKLCVNIFYVFSRRND